MSANAQNIIVQINKYVRNYAVDAFTNQRLNAILNQIVALADAATGATGNGSTVVELTSADFINDTDCPLTTLAGRNIAVFYNEASRFILKDASEWSDLPGGGFKVLLPNFKSTLQNFHFYVFTL